MPEVFQGVVISGTGVACLLQVVESVATSEVVAPRYV